MALTTLANVKTVLGITTTAEDAKLTIMVAAAIAAVKSYTNGIDFEGPTTRTEYYQPEDKILTLRWKPVVSITSVYEDGNANWGDGSGAYASDTLLTAGDDYALMRDGSGVNGEVSRTGRIQRINALWLKRVTLPTYRGTNWNAMVRAVEPAYGAVKVVYVSGFSSVPSDVEMAVIAEIDSMRQRAGHGGQLAQSESLGEYSYSSQPNMKSSEFGVLLSDEARALLAPYMGMRLTI